MTKGRKPKPYTLQVISGNPGKRPLPPPLLVETLYQEPPEALAGDCEAQNYWRYLMPYLCKYGLYTPLDLGALAGTCMAYGRLLRSHRLTAEKGDFYESEGEHGRMIRRHPASALASESWRDYRSGASEFGLSPASRKHLGALDARQEPSDRFARFER